MPLCKGAVHLQPFPRSFFFARAMAQETPTSRRQSTFAALGLCYVMPGHIFHPLLLQSPHSLSKLPVSVFIFPFRSHWAQLFDFEDHRAAFQCLFFSKEADQAVQEWRHKTAARRKTETWEWSTFGTGRSRSECCDLSWVWLDPLLPDITFSLQSTYWNNESPSVRTQASRLDIHSHVLVDLVLRSWTNL